MRIFSPLKRLYNAMRAGLSVLIGRTQFGDLTPTAKVRHAAALENDLLEVAAVLEKLHAWTSRQTQREARSTKKNLEAIGETPAVASVPVGAMSMADRKQRLRAYVSAQRRGLTPPPLPAPAMAPPVDQPTLFDPDNGSDPESEQNP